MNATAARIRSLVDSWKSDAEKRRKMSSLDFAADILEHCASELENELADAENADETVSVATYAAMHGKAPSTVRRWCQSGALPAQRKGGEYVIRRGEPCPEFGS
jgi:hypothetical protein